MPSGEYLSSNSLIAYPFKQGQYLPNELVCAFADASIASDEYSVKLTKFAYSVGNGSIEFVVNDITYKTTLLTTDPYIRVESGRSVFVLDAQFLNTIPDFSYEGEAFFEESCIYVDTDSVSSIEFFYGKGDPRNFTMSGDLSFVSGYNVTMTGSGSDVTINAKPGSGMGIVPCYTECTEDPETDGKPLVTDNGNAVITGDDCYEVTASGDTIQIHGKCVACCQCESYVDIVEELKRIADNVRKVNEDITKTKTGVYFDTMDKFSLVYNVPEIDVQMDIAPDSSIASIALRGNLEDGVDLREFHSFRVTCTVTNMCGLPCFFEVPDLWTPEQIRSTNAVHVFSQKKNKAGRTLSVFEQLHNGIEVTVIPKKGNPGFSIDTQAERWDENGWLQTSQCRGPLIRKTKDKTSKKRYETPQLAAPYVSDSALGVNTVADTCLNWALLDLKNNRNPSSTLKYAEMSTVALCADNSRAGFLMPAGYSIAITNTYMFPTEGIDFKDDEAAFSAAFFGQFYCPLAAYPLAYNMARPGNHTITKTDDGIKVSWDWEEGRFYKQAASPSTLRRMVFALKTYNVSTGKEQLDSPV